MSKAQVNFDSLGSGGVTPTLKTYDWIGGGDTKTFTVENTKQYIVTVTAQGQGYASASYVGYINNGSLTDLSTGIVNATMTNDTTLSLQNTSTVVRQSVVIVQLF